MYQLIDTHAHLEEIENLESVLTLAKEAGLAAIVAVGSDLASNQKTLDIAEKYPGFVYPALGWHPWYIKESEIAVNLEFIKANIDRAVAIGEVGLDYHKRVRAAADKALQKSALAELLKIAREHDKPALIHSRYAWRDAFDMVKGAGLAKAVFHWYTGTSSAFRDGLPSGLRKGEGG
jgi:TatD DNase family protein